MAATGGQEVVTGVGWQEDCPTHTNTHIHKVTRKVLIMITYKKRTDHVIHIVILTVWNTLSEKAN